MAKRRAILGEDMKYHCPRCNNWVAHWQKYCDECGQAFDWTGDPKIIVKPSGRQR